MARWTGQDEIDGVLAAGAAWRRNCLETDRSVLSDRSLWNEQNLEALATIFRDNPIGGTDATFITKLSVQLADAAPEVIQLAAEAVWFISLFPHASTTQPATKRQRVLEIWQRSGEQTPPRRQLLEDEALAGVGGTGTFYQTSIPGQFGFLIGAALAWKQRHQTELGEDEAAAWSFAAWLDSNPNANKWPIRHAILYFCFPEYFERNVSKEHRSAIYFALKSKLPRDQRIVGSDPSGVELDRAIFRIRSRLSQILNNHQIDFYRPPLAGMWSTNERDKRRAAAASAVEVVLSNYNLELHQTGSKKKKLSDTRPVDEVTGFWSNPSDATNKPLRWIIHLDTTAHELVATIPDKNGSSRIAYLNSGKGASGGVFIKIIPAIKLNDGEYDFFETWEWILMLCFLPALEAGSGAQLIENYNAADGSITYKGAPQHYVAAGLIALNDPDSIYFANRQTGPHAITYGTATEALRKLLVVEPLVSLENLDEIDDA